MPVKWEIVDVSERLDSFGKAHRSEGFMIEAYILDNVHLNMIDIREVMSLIRAWVRLRTGLETTVELWGSLRHERIEFICWYAQEQSIENLKPTITFKRTILEE